MESTLGTARGRLPIGEAQGRSNRHLTITGTCPLRSQQPPSVTDRGELDAFLDYVIQRLFATGVGIDAIVGQLDDQVLAARLAQHVADLDHTIAEIRLRIFGVGQDSAAG